MTPLFPSCPGWSARRGACALLLTASLLIAGPLLAQGDSGAAPEAATPSSPPASEAWPEGLWRSVGPTNMGGRVTDLAVVRDDPSTWYFAAATGGVWRTRNAGTTFEPIFDRVGPPSIGAVAVAPSHSKVVWVGTGEPNARNSVHPGGGVWRSKDGGDTWEERGLKSTTHIGRIAIHPTEPDTVLVAALGRVWGANAERGLYRTTDGGETWSLVLALGEDTGCIDLRIDPKEPRFVYAAAYEVRRDAFDGNDPMTRFGERSGIYRSSDGGLSFERLTEGLPTMKIGRIGLDLYDADPKTLFAVIETERTGQGEPGREPKRIAFLGVRAENREEGLVLTQITAGQAAAKAGLKAGDVLLSLGKTTTGNYAAMVEAIRAREPGEKATVSIRRDGDRLELPVTMGEREDQGADDQRFRGSQGGQQANRQDRQGERGFETGGIFRSDDRGSTWRRINSLNPRPFYYSQIRVNPVDDQELWVLGIQVHVSRNGGESFSPRGAPGVHVDHHALWIDPNDRNHLILGNDGGIAISYDSGSNWEISDQLPIGQYYAIAVDRRKPYTIYGGLQDNGTWATPSDTDRAYGLTPDLTFKIGGGDGFLAAVDPSDENTVYIESQNGNIRRVNLGTGASASVRRARGNGRASFNWRTPFLLAPQNPHTLYFGGQRVWRSIDRGSTSRPISPRLNASERGTLTALDVSRIDERILWAGTDDGALWMSADGGGDWTRLDERLPGLPGPRWVAEVVASRHDRQRAWVVLTAHRSDDHSPYVFRTDDSGKSFQRVGGGLPQVVTRALVEDRRDENLVYVGHDRGVSVSRDGGASFRELGDSLPFVPVHDMVQHPDTDELVVGTHGRGLWIADVGPLSELDSSTRKKPVAILDVTHAERRPRHGGFGRYGAQRARWPGAPRGARIHYWLAEPSEELEISIQSLAGKTLRKLKVDGTQAGWQRIVWDLRTGSGRRLRSAPPGAYRVRISAGPDASDTQAFELQRSAAERGAGVSTEDLR